MGGPGASLTPRLPRRAAEATLAALGPRWVLVADGPPSGRSAVQEAVPEAVPEAAPDRAPWAGGRPCAAVALGAAPLDPPWVRGAPRALPVASESATGVLVACDDPARAAACAPEARRLLQPGGVVVFLSTWPAGEVAAFDEILADAGLATRWRRAVRLADESDPSGWWGERSARRRAAAARAEVRVACLVAAGRAGDEPEEALPTSGATMAALFLPRRRTRGR